MYGINYKSQTIWPSLFVITGPLNASNHAMIHISNISEYLSSRPTLLGISRISKM